MKKFGFTMAELLVTLSIVGIIAAITAPVIGDLFPDKDKAMVLKVYKILSDINQEILNDPSLYKIEYISPNGGASSVCRQDHTVIGVVPGTYVSCEHGSPCCSPAYKFLCSGLDCLQRPDSSEYDSYSPFEVASALKYSTILMKKMEGEEIGTGNPKWQHSGNGPTQIYRAFYTRDGLKWDINYFSDGTWDYRVKISRRDASNPCSYNSETCTNPEEFVFRVKVDGRVYGEDPLTQAYLMNPTKMNDKKHDKAVASSL